MLVLALLACSKSYFRGEFQEGVPGGAQAIFVYEMQGGEGKRIVQPIESTTHFIETKSSYARGELSFVCIVISEVCA